MTGCLYISPKVPGAPNGGVVPILFADTLVTWRAPHLVGANQVIPANVTSRTINSLSDVTLARKLHIIDSPKGTTAVALAGDGAKIRECLSTLHWNIEGWEDDERPMRSFGDNINLYQGAIEAIGIYVNKTTGVMNTMARDGLLFRPTFGMTAAIGSGAADLSILTEELRHKSRFKDVGALIIRVSNAIIGKRLAQEIYSENRNSWGGLVEMTYICGWPPQWEFGLRSLHLFYELEVVNREIRSVKQIPRIVGYDPGEAATKILSICDGSGASAITFVLDNNQSVYPPSAIDWCDWQPRTASVTFITRNNETIDPFTITVPTQEISSLGFFATGKDISICAEQGYIERLLKRAMRGRKSV